MPSSLLTKPYFPADGSIVLSMVSYKGEQDVPVCICGSCYDGFCDHANVDGCYIVRQNAAHSRIGLHACGTVPGFAGCDRVMLRIPGHMWLEPFGRGAGKYQAAEYQLYTCVESAPTPHDEISYEYVLIMSCDDMTDWLREQLQFVSDSPVVGGPVKEYSMIFHGHGGEELGIDMAIAFVAREPGKPRFVYAYRTLARVRDCGIRGTVRINHDVVRHTGRSFINQVRHRGTCYSGASGVLGSPLSARVRRQTCRRCAFCAPTTCFAM